MIVMKTISSITLAAVFGGLCCAQTNPILGEDTVKVSGHVWAILGFPNISIIVGSNAALVVDTGLGPRNGATIAKVAEKLAPGKKLYLTTTHFHPEHAAGEPGFPAGTILIRNRVQQEEMEQHGQEIIDTFSNRNAQMKELLAGVKLRAPDEVFDKDRTLDLGGGVTARLVWFGEAHTKGDELIFVQPDRTLISGDVVQNKVVPNISSSGGTPSSWIAVLDQIEKLGALRVLPDHSAIGGGSLVAQERAFIVDLRTRALELKRQGVSAAEAGQRLTSEFKMKYPDWPINSVANFVNSIYAE